MKACSICLLQVLLKALVATKKRLFVHLQGSLYFWSYMYYLSKYYELLDTVLLALKVIRTMHAVCSGRADNDRHHKAHLDAGQGAIIPACLPPQRSGHHGLPVAGGRAVAPADRLACKHGHPCADVPLLLHVCHQAPPTMEETGHPGPNSAVCVQVSTRTACSCQLHASCRACC